MDKPSLYDALAFAGCETDNHYSDLYVRITPEALAIVEHYPELTRTHFRHAVTGEGWLDFPFQFTPYWVQKQTNA